MLEKMKWLFVDDRAEDEHSRDELEVAVCVLMCQAARMDDEFDIRERVMIRQLMRERFGLPEAEAEALDVDLQRLKDIMAEEDGDSSPAS